MNPPVIHSHRAHDAFKSGVVDELPKHFFNGASGLSGFGSLGETSDLTKQNEEFNKKLDAMTNSPAFQIWRLLSIASTAACAYHGYKRNDSVGWAVGWALLGGMFPVITPAIAVAQGFGKKKGE